MTKLKILFVCTGNICRSPLAEGIFLDYIALNKMSHKFEVDSAGTASYHVGSLADLRSINTAEKHSITLKHIARQITKTDLDYYDFVMVMDHRNYEDVLSILDDKQASSRVLLLRSFDPEINNDIEYTVPDPYYGLEADFEDVYLICKRSIEGFVAYLVSQNLLT